MKDITIKISKEETLNYTARIQSEKQTAADNITAAL